MKTNFRTSTDSHLGHSMSNQHTYFPSPSQIFIKFGTLLVFIYTKKNIQFYENISISWQNIILEIRQKLGKTENLSDVKIAAESLKIMIGR